MSKFGFSQPHFIVFIINWATFLRVLEWLAWVTGYFLIPRKRRHFICMNGSWNVFTFDSINTAFDIIEHPESIDYFLIISIQEFYNIWNQSLTVGEQISQAIKITVNKKNNQLFFTLTFRLFFSFWLFLQGLARELLIAIAISQGICCFALIP